MYLNPPNASKHFDLPIKSMPKPKSVAAKYILFMIDTYVWPGAVCTPKTSLIKRTWKRD